MPFADSPHEPPQLPSRKTFQFSLRTMMLGMTGFALWCGIVAVLPGFLSNMLLGALWLAGSGWLLTGIVFARGDLRAFCIGAAVVVTSTWTGIGGQFLEAFRALGLLLLGGLVDPYSGRMTSMLLWFKHLALFGAALANGYLCIRARRYFERQDED